MKGLAMTFRRNIQKISAGSVLPLALFLGTGTQMSAQISAQTSAQTSAYAQSAERVPAFKAHADSVTPETANKVMQATIWLKLHDQKGLDATVAQLYQEGSPSYQHWLTPAQLAKYKPTAEDVTAVKKELASTHLKIVATEPSNLYVRVSGTVAELQSAFSTKINRYSYRGKTITAAASEGKLSGPAGSLVAHLGGLSGSQMEPYVKRPINPKTRQPLPFVPLESSLHAAAVTPDGAIFAAKCFRDPESHVFTTPGRSLPVATYYGNRYGADNGNTIPGTLATCGYSPIELQTAYSLTSDYGQGLEGQGQTIVIVDAYGSPTLRGDLAAFNRYYHQPQMTQTSLHIYYPNGAPTATDSDWALETTLDVEWAHAVAPLAKIALVVAPTNLNSDLQAAVSYALTNQLGNTISNSYGNPEALSDTGDMLISNSTGELAAAAGVSVNFATGDSGDFAVGTGLATVSTPSNSPYVTAVGGTSVALFGNGNNHIKFQTGWGNNATQISYSGDGSPIDPPIALGFVFGGGGGESQFFPKPKWQKNLPGKGRQQPDVSAIADPMTGVEIVMTQDGQMTVGTIGGTSLSCPFFSGIWAIANQKAGHPLGLAAAHLYNLPKNAFYDVGAHSSPTDVAGTIFDNNGSTFYSRGDLVAPLQNTRSFYTALWDFGEGAFFDLSFGTDSSLVVGPGWDNVTGMGTPNGLSFIREVAQ
jgi:subtilase family serine protease